VVVWVAVLGATVLSRVVVVAVVVGVGCSTAVQAPSPNTASALIVISFFMVLF
jgi:hypothetical protein